MTAHSTACTAKIDSPMGRNGLRRVFLTRGTKFFHPLMPDGVTEQAPPQGPPRAGVRGVERDVGLVRAELVLVVGEVHAPVELHRGEDGIRHHPLADPVVPPLVGEEELVRRLVHEDGEAGVERAHEDERDQVAPPLVDPDGATDGERHPEPHRRDRDGVAEVVDAAQVRPQRRDGHAVGEQPLAGQDVGPVGGLGHHGAGHALYITEISQVTQPRNTGGGPDDARAGDAADGPIRPGQRAARHGPARAAGGPARPPDRPLRHQREPGPGGAEPHGGERRGHVRRRRALPAGGPPGGAPVAPVGQPRRVGRRLRRGLVAGRGHDDGQLGRRPGRPTPDPGLRAAGRAARGRVDASGQPGRAPDRRPGRRRRTHDGAARGRRDVGTAAVGPSGLVGARPWPVAMPSMRSRPTGPRRWRRGSSSRPRCSGTCRRIRCCRPSCCPADWPGGALRAAYDRWDARYRATLSEWSRAGA